MASATQNSLPSVEACAKRGAEKLLNIATRAIIIQLRFISNCISYVVLFVSLLI